jgi:outer membrane lipase/esterase
VTETAWAKNPKDVVYVIGDSLSDNGNLYALIGYPTSPPYAYRFSNGPVWAEYFAEQLRVKLEDLAYGGAFTGQILLPVPPPTVSTPTAKYLYSNYLSYEYFYGYVLLRDLPGVKEEIEGLLAAHPNGLNPDALYVVWAGANDFFAALENPTQTTTILAAAVQNITSTDEDNLGLICRLSQAGARHFAVANLPDIGLTPFGQSFGPAAAYDISELAKQFNQALKGALAALPPECARTLVILDAFDALGEIYANPDAYGLGNVSEPCLNPMTFEVCTEPDTYLFWDLVHPTTYGHSLFAERFRAAFCGTGDQHPGLRGRPDGQPPPIWRGACYGSK